jgi:hypothetical protein
MGRCLLLVVMCSCNALSCRAIDRSGGWDADLLVCEVACRELLQRELSALRSAHHLEIAAMAAKYETQLTEERIAWLAMQMGRPSEPPKLGPKESPPADANGTPGADSDTAVGEAHSRWPQMPLMGAKRLPPAQHPGLAERRSDASRLLLQGDPSDKACSKAEVQQVLLASDPTPVVMAMLGTNAACALCIIPCAAATLPDLLPCFFGCQHQRENRCDSTTGLERVAPLIQRATIHDRSSVIALLEVAEAVRRVHACMNWP